MPFPDLLSDCGLTVESLGQALTELSQAVRSCPVPGDYMYGMPYVEFDQKLHEFLKKWEKTCFS